MEIGLVSNALHEAFEKSDFYDLGYNNQCDNYCDMYDNGRNALCEAFNSALSERLSSMTNGDVIKAMFPGVIIVENKVMHVMHIQFDVGCSVKFSIDWWNAPYKRD